MTWCISGHKVPREEVIFLFQVALVYIIVVTSIVNLSLDKGEREVWLVLLSSATGYLLPSPSMRNGILPQPSKQHEAQVEHDV